MDDFGTGYSSLSYLQFLPFDKIKINKPLLAIFATASNQRGFARAVIAPGRGLDMPVVADGVV